MTTTPAKGPISDAGELDVSWQFQRISGTLIHKKHIKAGNGQSGSNAATTGYLHSGVRIALDNTERLQRVRGIAANTYGRMISSGPDAQTRCSQIWFSDLDAAGAGLAGHQVTGQGAQVVDVK